jgi:hypothetical protein
MRIAPLILFLPLLCAAAEPPAEVRALEDRAQGAPAEFSADVLIRLAGLDKLDKAYRIRLLEDAFQRAGQAQQPYRRRPSVSYFDGQSGFLDRAYSQELDGMTLRMRAIEALLPLAPAKARQLFSDLSAPKLPRLDCSSSLTYDVTRFYSTLGKVAALTFSAKEIQDEEPFKFLMRYSTLTSPAQIGPVAELIATAKLTDPQFQALVAFFSTSLKQLGGDDRAFTSARPFAVQIRQLRQAIEKRGGSPVPMLEAYRAYLVRHLSGPRCGDTSRMEIKVSLESIPTAVSEAQAAANAAPYFNQVLRVDPIPPLTDKEQTPSKTEGEAKGLQGCTAPECKAIGTEYRNLIMKDAGIALRSDERTTPEWQTRLQQMLTSMADWKQDTGATEAEHFRFKVTVFSDLLAVTPPGPSRDTVLRALHDYLRSSRLEVENRLEWFLPVNVLLGKVSLDPLGLGKLGEELRASGDAVIAMYAELDRVASRSPERIVPLF